MTHQKGNDANNATTIIPISWWLTIFVFDNCDVTAIIVIPISFKIFEIDVKASASKTSENVIEFNGKKTNFIKRKKDNLTSWPGAFGIKVNNNNII